MPEIIEVVTSGSQEQSLPKLVQCLSKCKSPRDGYGEGIRTSCSEHRRKTPDLQSLVQTKREGCLPRLGQTAHRKTAQATDAFHRPLCLHHPKSRGQEATPRMLRRSWMQIIVTESDGIPCEIGASLKG
ncbi:hypothetical protein ISCGN_010558 [Ixodes scapularis]